MDSVTHLMFYGAESNKANDVKFSTPTKEVCKQRCSQKMSLIGFFPPAVQFLWFMVQSIHCGNHKNMNTCVLDVGTHEDSLFYSTVVHDFYGKNRCSKNFR